MSESIEALIGLSASALGVLLPAFKVVEQMSNTYKAIKFAKARCKAVIRRAALIIKGIHESAQNTGTDIPSSHLTELLQKLEDVQAVIQKLAEMSFLKALIRSDMINQEIDLADRHLSDCLQIFQVELLLRAQAEKDSAAKTDRAALQDILKKLTGNYAEIRRRFGINTDQEENQAMVAMERKLSETESVTQTLTIETQIIRSSLECIKLSTGKNSPKQNRWLITDYELDFGGTIGGGGFSTVRKAKFKGTTVAVKMLKNVDDSKALEGEIDIWSTLRHDHIVPFYGASTLTSTPYIVSRYMRNGNLIQYLYRKPTVDRARLIYEVSLGMFYLHCGKIVHGDLKGVNVLVDDAGKACITDFGLSTINGPASVGTTTNKISGTLRFLAPEALKGTSLNFATDVYAFGMIIYEIFAGESPFINIPDHVVMQGNLTLTRPTSSDVSARGLDDTMWQLLLDATSRDPAERPLFAAIMQRLEPTKGELFGSQTFALATMRISEEEHVTKWAYESASPCPTANNSKAPLIRKDLSSEKPRSTPRSSLTYDVDSERPMSAEVTCKYFSAEFGLMKSREPGVYFEENGSFHWQPISAKKGTLRRVKANSFTYRRTIGEGNNSWELDGNKVTLHSSWVDAECCFRNAQAAKKWFDLQLSYARDGNVAAWGSSRVTGDWITKSRSWRRVVGGKLQMARPLEGAPNLTPSSWNKVDLPKRYMIDDSAENMDSITCIVNPGSLRSGKYCCDLKGRTITFTTYRSSLDRTPALTVEETYPSEAEAWAMFTSTKTIFKKGSDKKKH